MLPKIAGEPRSPSHIDLLDMLALKQSEGFTVVALRLRMLTSIGFMLGADRIAFQLLQNRTHASPCATDYRSGSRFDACWAYCSS